MQDMDPVDQEPSVRNRYVLRRESGHPGYSNVVVLGTADDLLAMADSLRGMSERGGRVEHYVTEEKNPDSLGAPVQGSIWIYIARVHGIGL